MTDDVRLSKTMSHALRHDPAAYGLSLDDAGWVDLGSLVTAIGRALKTRVTIDDVERVIAQSPKRRFESDGVSVRAAYGHSIDGRIDHAPVTDPPATLFHATSPDAAALIATQGLRPMARQYVHLALDEDTAVRVGRRKSPTPVLLTVDAAAFVAAGHRLYTAGPAVLLADAVPPAFIRLS